MVLWSQFWDGGPAVRKSLSCFEEVFAQVLDLVFTVKKAFCQQFYQLKEVGFFSVLPMMSVEGAKYQSAVHVGWLC